MTRERLVDVGVAVLFLASVAAVFIAAIFLGMGAAP